MKTIRIGTRASRLAIIQAEMVAQAITAYNPKLRTELVPMTTTGDKILNQKLDKIGGKGLFVKELDRALLEEKVDITVHSCKDLPVELNEYLPVVATSRREDPSDVLVLPAGINRLDTTKPVGCSSARRRIQLQGLFPGVRVESVRGNVLTRLEKLDRGEYSALVLAAAGLNRLGLGSRATRTFTTVEMLPAACQGILAVQARQSEDTSWLAGFHSETSMHCMLAERAFIRALDGGCSKPCAAYAVPEKGGLLLQGLYVSDDETVMEYAREYISLADIEGQAAVLAERTKANAQGQSGFGRRGAG